MDQAWFIFSGLLCTCFFCFFFFKSPSNLMKQVEAFYLLSVYCTARRTVRALCWRAYPVCSAGMLVQQ